MAKELPYFKFEPAEYLTGDISFCSLAAQGLFVNICCYYWQRNCKLTKDQLLKRLKYENELNELIDEGIINLNENDITIDFLLFQYNEVQLLSSKNSANGKKGGRPIKTQIKPKQKPNETQTKGIREDKIRKEEIKENYIYNCLKDDAWIESVSRINKTNKDKIDKMLLKFESHLTSIGETKKNIKEYKSHFNNWLRKQDLRPVKKRLEL